MAPRALLVAAALTFIAAAFIPLTNAAATSATDARLVGHTGPDVKRIIAVNAEATRADNNDISCRPAFLPAWVPWPIWSALFPSDEASSSCVANGLHLFKEKHWPVSNVMTWCSRESKSQNHVTRRWGVGGRGREWEAMSVCLASFLPCSLISLL